MGRRGAAGGGGVVSKPHTGERAEAVQAVPGLQGLRRRVAGGDSGALGGEAAQVRCRAESVTIASEETVAEGGCVIRADGGCRRVRRPRTLQSQSAHRSRFRLHVLRGRRCRCREDHALIREWEGALADDLTNDGAIVGIERDQLESDDKFLRHLAQVVRNGLGDRAGTCIDPRAQIVQGRTVCVVSCQRSPEPVFLKWKGLESVPEGDFFVRSGPGTVKLPPDSAREYIRTRFDSRVV
jgi:hypothetical protein